MLKQVILVRIDLQLPKGKMAAQVAHASVEAYIISSPAIAKKWHTTGMKKIVLKVKDLKELHTYIQQAKDAALTTAVITDAGHTVVEPGTVTCGAIGPSEESMIDLITGKLQMM